MIRVVLDTNIIVSALLQPLGPRAQVLSMAIGGSIQLCISGSVYAEYEEVIRRPRLRRAEDIVAGVLNFVREEGLWAGPRRPSEVVPTGTTMSFLNVRKRLERIIWSPAILSTFPRRE